MDEAPFLCLIGPSVNGTIPYPLFIAWIRAQLMVILIIH